MVFWQKPLPFHCAKKSTNVVVYWALWRIPISSKYFDCWLVATALAGLHWLWMKLDQVVQRLSSRLKLQPGSSENNPNVPVLVEVWQPALCSWDPVQMVWGNATAFQGRYGGKHFLCNPEHCSGEMGPATKLSRDFLQILDHCHRKPPKLQNMGKLCPQYNYTWSPSQVLGDTNITQLKVESPVSHVSDFLWLGELFQIWNLPIKDVEARSKIGPAEKQRSLYEVWLCRWEER